MNRSPIFRSLFLLLCFILIGIPLYVVTRDREQQSSASQEINLQDSNLVEHLITVRTAHPFSTLQISQGETLKKLKEDTEAFFADSFSPDKLLSLKLEWPEGTPETAILVEIEREEYSFSKTYWAERRLDIEIPLHE